LSEAPLPRRFSVSNAPNSIENVQDISSWQDLYKERRAWAVRLAEECRRRHVAAQERYDEIDVMIKCLDAAVANLEISIKQIEPKYTELKNWVGPALTEHEQLASNWERYLDLARNTPVSPTMVRFMTRRESNKSHPTLEDLIELDTAKKAGKLASTAHRRFKDKATDLDQVANKMYKGLEGLIADFDKLMARSIISHSNDTAELLEDIEAVVKQIDSDYRTALGYGNSQRDVAQASKTASNHTERLVPTLKKRASDMDDMLRYATKARNDISRESITFMQAITDITSLHSSVKNQINVLNQSEDDMTTFDYLRLIHQLPYMYASFVVEAIRRREWIDKVKTDSSTLANEMALFQDEESKRRRRWQKMVGSTYGPSLDTNVMGLEVNLLGDDTPWPSVPKDELESFIQSLEAQGTDQSIVEDVTKLVQELTSPTKQQSKRLKAFKNGSVHEAALGRSGLMIRGDDELLRSLQDDKSKLESKVKTAESRIRRLEDLLHRQSQASRPGNLFQPQNNQSYERHNSVSSEKPNRPEDQGSEANEALVRRVAQLETELQEERERSSRFQKDLNNHATQHDDMKDQIQEVNSTKKDLLENMEALKREFLDERKSLEDEIKTLKARLEETEDEIENFDVSRENEKTSYDEKIQSLEAEVQRLTNGWGDETLKMQGQVDFLRKESRMQREQIDASERQISDLQSENRNISKKLQVTDEDLERHRQTIHKLFVELMPEKAAMPDSAQDLTEVLMSRAADLVVKLDNTEQDVALLRADLEQATHTAKELRTELADTKDRLSTEEMAVMHARESLAEEKAKAKALEDDVSEGRDQLSLLRKQLSDGETGSETLQKKLEEEEKKVMKLSEEAASRKSQLGSLEEELRLFREKSDDVQSKFVRSNALHEARDDRTKDLTQRLYSQNDRLTRLLERTGYSVSRSSEGMTVARLPRLERSTQNPNDSSDPGSSLRRSVSIGGRAMTDSTDLELLYWMNGNDPAVETEKYDAFMAKLGNFDVDLFSETLYHRIKEAEHKARKWQREARSYRDRAHTMQKESHDKIAFKHFKEGDLALFLPTRNQQAGAWAAFNVGFPHYFLREQDSHRLRHREWLVARITRVQERVVDLSKSLQQPNESDSINDEENDNPFQLSDGLRWYLIDAVEDKPGAPATPGMGKSTVAANNVEATADMHVHASKGKGKNRESVASIEGINKTLSKSLESRRSSSGSKKALPFAIGGTGFLKNSSALASETNSLRAVAPDTPSGTSPTHGGLLTAANAGTGQADVADSQRVARSNDEAQKQVPGQVPGPNVGGGNNSEVRDVDSLLGP
jgi:autophagy-related protein 11